MSCFALNSAHGLKGVTWKAPAEKPTLLRPARRGGNDSQAPAVEISASDLFECSARRPVGTWCLETEVGTFVTTFSEDGAATRRVDTVQGGRSTRYDRLGTWEANDDGATIEWKSLAGEPVDESEFVSVRHDGVLVGGGAGGSTRCEGSL